MPSIVVLCGSTRFRDEFHHLNRHFTLLGQIVLAPGVYGHADGIRFNADEKAALDELHQAKIRVADYVFVVNMHGYLGESTAAEIAYAEELGKPIVYLHPNPEAIR
jgi:hypothetical protein